jgi:hydroxymethylglutaryl-CoA lyase
MANVELVEVAPRDGLQNEAVSVSTADKVALVRRTIAAGARRVEVTSFVNPARVPQMADSEAVMAALRAGPDLRAQGVSLIGLVLNQRGYERAVAADMDEINLVVVASETFNLRNQGVPIAQTLLQCAAIAEAARARGLKFGVSIAAAFGCPFEGETPADRIGWLAREAAALGAAEITLADTIGVADPLAVRERLAIAAEAAPGVVLRCHFHDTRNTGLANAYAAYLQGVRSFDTALGGIGGCPFAPAATGNIATEDTAYMFERMGVRTGLELPALLDAAAWLSGVLGRPALPASLGRAGLFPPLRPAA